AQDAGIVDKLQRVGIPTVVVDYFEKPLQNTVPSVRLMGQLLGRDPQAEQYVQYYQAAIDRVRSRLNAAHQPPTPTFLWRAPGYFDCCSSFANSNLAELVKFAGGANLADPILKTRQGAISPETILSRKPAVIIATGADWSPGTPAKPGSFVALGYNQTRQNAQKQFQAIIDNQAGFNQLGAVRDHRAYVAWHHFYDSPYNFLAVEWFAKWMHPDLFKDVDPDTTIRELHSKFLPIPYRGTFWTDLP
ncbi:ABC transporter substrate-binding protein, partial [Sciscionella marina]|uniref:ABC transporter substrate-binding protein n=1 Tax=Sciscionella marina TaxID=508770 RepID=UPI00037BB2CC